ncbi:MAG: M28 family peptidase [bacterium]
MQKFDSLNYVKELIKLSPRQLGGETKTAMRIMETLEEYGIDFTVQEFSVKIPKWSKCSLIADGKTISCRPSGMVSGKITSKDNIISSLTGSQAFLTRANVNFNPQCPGLSSPSHYFAPAISVIPGDLLKIINAKKILGNVTVKPIKHRSLNIMAGNIDNPKAILFAHYDSIGLGATDNASGVAVTMAVIIKKPSLLDACLFVFAGCEELSYDKPYYWGAGFRAFERRYPKLFDKTKKIIAVDCVGNDNPHWSNNPDLLEDAFPIKNFNRHKKKIWALYGSIDKLMAVYHSDLDDMSQLSTIWLKKTVDDLIKNL